MRKHQPIWDRLKRDLTASLSASPAMHKRIIKAVIKEKNRDLGWKLLTSEESKHYRLRYQINGALITFHLDFFVPHSNL